MAEDLMGRKFGKLTVIKRINTRRWLCECECGNQKEAVTSDLVRGNAKSCGCLLGEKYFESMELRKHLIGCPYPSYSCRENRLGKCCRECEKLDHCENACQNSPERCGRNKKTRKQSKKA